VSIQIRLEAMKLAISHGLSANETLTTAERYAKYIATGPEAKAEVVHNLDGPSRPQKDKTNGKSKQR
jgi:hypothetical protein